MKKGYSIFLVSMGSMFDAQAFMPDTIDNFFDTLELAEYYLSYGEMETTNPSLKFVILSTYKGQ